MSKELTPAKKAAIDRYLSRHVRFNVTMTQEDFDELMKHINATGVSRNSFILEAISEKISKKGG